MILISLDYAVCSGSSSSDVDIGHLTLDDGQLCPAELEQALQGDSLLLMACSAGYYQLAQVIYTGRLWVLASTGEHCCSEYLFDDKLYCCGRCNVEFDSRLIDEVA